MALATNYQQAASPAGLFGIPGLGYQQAIPAAVGFLDNIFNLGIMGRPDQGALNFFRDYQSNVFDQEMGFRRAYRDKIQQDLVKQMALAASAIDDQTKRSVADNAAARAFQGYDQSGLGDTSLDMSNAFIESQAATQKKLIDQQLIAQTNQALGATLTDPVALSGLGMQAAIGAGQAQQARNNSLAGLLGLIGQSLDTRKSVVDANMNPYSTFSSARSMFESSNQAPQITLNTPRFDIHGGNPLVNGFFNGMPTSMPGVPALAGVPSNPSKLMFGGVKMQNY